MPMISLEQALLVRPDEGEPRLVARSAGFETAWVAEAAALVVGFGVRPGAAVRCPLAVFAKPISAKHVAVVRVRDELDETSRPTGLRFHILVATNKDYETWIRDPFILGEKVEATWDASDVLPSLTIAETTFSPRTITQVQNVLKRIKASALREGEDPESPDFERTPENSESPALLGGAQVLVDGGRLIFERPDGDLALVSGLWLLLPEVTRSRLWPTSFAFSPELEFDVLVVARADEAMLESYTTEEQAAHYPEGTYEIALQRAAEQGTQADVDSVFLRRDSHSTIRLALLVLALVLCMLIFSRLLDWWMPPPRSLSVPQQQAVAVAGMVGSGEPWTIMGIYLHGKSMWNPEKKDAK